MADPRETHYDSLGISRDARPVEIQRAYDKFVADLPKAETPPDPRRERRIRDAWAVLSDPAQREAYDATLAAAAREQARRKRGTALAVGSAVLALVAGIVGWNALKSSVKPSSSAAARPVAQIAAEAGRALGRVEAYDLSGRVTTLGYGVAIEAGTMAVACPTLGAGAQIRVHNGQRAVSARVTHKSEPLGLCLIAVEGSGAASPLPVASAVPGVGEKVFAATLDAAGEARLVEGRVKRVRQEGARTLVESTGAGAGAEGAVLLDAAGRVLGLAPGATPDYDVVTKAFVAQRPAGT